MFSILLLSVLALGLFWFYRYRKYNAGYFERLGLPGPKPDWLFGNTRAFAKKPVYETFQAWTAKYGKIYGYVEGNRPVIVLSDLDLVQEVFVKRFSNFHSRKGFALAEDPETGENISMFFARGIRWKRLRSVINPTFSMSKLKQMAPMMEQCCKVLTSKVKPNETVDIYRYLQELTLSTIGMCAFGMNNNAQTNPDDPLLQRCRNLFRKLERFRPLFIMSVLAPELKLLWRPLHRLTNNIVDNPYLWLRNAVGDVVEKRKKSNMKKSDMIQMMLEAESDGSVSSLDDSAKYTMSMCPSADQKLSNGETHQVNGHAWTNAYVKRTTSKKQKLTPKEIQNQALLFLLAGYETTSACLAYCIHLLATHPEVQLRLQQEVDTYADDMNDQVYDSLRKMEYLDMVICETLRLYPIASNFVARECMQTCEVNGFTFPKGVIVQVDTWSIHRDPELWEEPDKFKPERFNQSEKQRRHPMAWVPFGIGPRNCIGMRFALMEVKITLCYILRHFTVTRCVRTEDTLPIKERGSISPETGVFVRFVQR